MHLPLALLFSVGLSQVLAETVVTTTSTCIFPVYPSGVSNDTIPVDGTVPLDCSVGCFYTAGIYITCFVNQTLPNGRGQQNQTFCDDFLCNQTNFYGLSQCLNCIIANGGERPEDYPTNTTFNPATATLPSYPPGIPHLDGWIDTSLANQILQNVTGRCSAVNKPLTGASTITATATTTGPYAETFTSGQSKNMPIWTGLSQYSIPVATNTFTLTRTLSSAPASTSQGAASGSAASASSSVKSGADRIFGVGTAAVGAVLGSILFVTRY